MRQLIDLTINEKQLEKTIELAREKNIIIPTLLQMKTPDLIPDFIKERLKGVNTEDLHPLNLFRITWKNQPTREGGLYNKLPNYVEFSSKITGVKARIIALSGKYFPVGAHKVGPSFSCLAPRLLTGQFDPLTDSAVWPSTGNYCRGGAYISKLLGCKSIAILPENMSQERFDWLKKVANEVIATIGCESNVKEIYDETWNLRRTRPEAKIFNQFAELANTLWHYEVTGDAMQTVIKEEIGVNGKVAGVSLCSGSAGTLGSGEFIKDQYPGAKIVVGEALQCSTLYNNGFGDHRIEGIGDKHVPWIHNVKNTDFVTAIDDSDAMAVFRLFNEKAGQDYLRLLGVSEDVINKLNWCGISGAANIIGAIKFAKSQELTKDDIVLTVLTDAAEMYSSRLEEMKEERGGREYNFQDAAIDLEKSVYGIRTDNFLELSLEDKKRIHNLKYYTWIEQQGMDIEELNAQWYDYDNYWNKLHRMAPEIDALIEQFNEKTGLLK